MTFAGARGATESQMATALHFTLAQAQLHPAFNAIDLALASRGKGAAGKDGQGFRLNVANALWGQTGASFEGPFLDTLAQSYGAGMHVVDFIGAAESSRVLINDWVSDRTEKRIKDLLPRDRSARIRGWCSPTPFISTRPGRRPSTRPRRRRGNFTLSSGSTVKVETMSGYKEAAYGAGADYAAVALPYDGDELSMVLILPAQGGLDAFEAALTPARLDTLVSGMTQHGVTMTLPRFKIESSFSLADQLSKLGMVDAFNDAADFSGIDGKKGMSIGSVVHKAYVDVSETGTEAAAATGVTIGVTSAPEPAEIHLDHPYLFLIRDNATKSILFLGRVEDPTPRLEES